VSKKRAIMAGKREKTRESIIEASYALFVEKGFKQVTMKDVCEVTGMSRGGLYSHFSGTDELFEAVLDRITKNNSMDFQTEIKKGSSATEILNRALDLMEEEMKHPEDSLSVAIYEYSETVDSDLMERLNRNAEKKWKKLIAYGIKRGEFREINADEIVNIILYSYQGVRMWSSIVSIEPKMICSITNHIKKQLIGEK
jgi:AcrR family transcriptional regulator